jgi:hypothetical protein
MCVEIKGSKGTKSGLSDFSQIVPFTCWICGGEERMESNELSWISGDGGKSTRISISFCVCRRCRGRDIGELSDIAAHKNPGKDGFIVRKIVENNLLAHEGSPS